MSYWYWALFFVLSIQGIFLIVILLLKIDKKNHSFLWVVGIIALITIQLLFFGFGYASEYEIAARLYSISILSPVVFGILFYFFFRSNLSIDKYTYKDFIHLIPLLIYVVMNSGIFFSDNESKAIALEVLYNIKIPNLKLKDFYMSAFVVGVNIFYMKGCYTFLQKKESLAKSKSVFKYALVCYAWYLTTFIIYKISLFLGMGYHSYLCIGIKLFMGLSIYGVAYSFLSISSSDLYEIKKEKYVHSSLNKNKKEMIWIKLDNYINKEKKYLNSELKLSSIASELKIPTNYLSQVINEKVEGGYNRFINALRINHSKELLRNTDLKIFAVAMESGFGNKNTFNQEFKRQVGKTPSNYRSSQKKDSGHE